MKKLCQSILAFLMVCTLVCSFGTISNATGTTTMYLSSNSPKVGETLKVTVTGSASSTITVKYNATILNFVSCDVNGYTQSGNTVSFAAKSGSIDFKLAESGSANIIVSSDTLSGCSAQISVTGSASDTAETPAETPVEDAAAEGDSAEITGEGAVPEAGKIGTETSYIVVMTPDALFSDALVEASYSSESGAYNLYQFEGVSNEFYYVYGENEAGVVGWYVFDSSTAQYFKADTQVLSKVGASAVEEESDKSELFANVKEYCKENIRNILTILILIVAIIVVIIINIRVFRNSEAEDDGSDIFGDLKEQDPETSIFKEKIETEEDADRVKDKTKNTEKTVERETEKQADTKTEKVDEDADVPVLDMSVVNEVLSEKKSEETVPTETANKEHTTSGNREINLMDLNNL